MNARLGARDLFEELAQVLQLSSGDVVADVCCGAGQHLARYAERGATALGFDFSGAAVAEARARHANAEVADAAALPLPDGSVDKLSCAFGIYYLTDPCAALREWARVLRPGGRVVIAGPAHGTNAELYAFHEQATGCGPSDADRMAWGYVEDVVRPALADAGFAEPALQTFVNPVIFPDAAAFLDYWRSTSLFLRSGVQTSNGAAALLAGQPGPFRVTKRVSILAAVRCAQADAERSGP